MDQFDNNIKHSNTMLQDDPPIDLDRDVEKIPPSRSEDPSLAEVAQFDPALDRRVVRKLDLHLVPLVFILYLLAYLDRSNIGNAKIAGMQDRLKLDSSSYAWLLTIFYIAYIVFEPLALMWKVVPPHIWAAFTIMGWAICGTLQATTYNWSGMMVARFFLGAFECSFVPGIPYLLSFFYLRNEMGVRCGWYVSAAPLATCFAGALAYGITSGHPHGIASWRLLFLVEGLPGIIAAVATFFLLPDSPETAKFLTEEERIVAKSRAMRQVGKDRVIGLNDVNLRDIWLTLWDAKAWIYGLMYFSCGVSYSSLPVFLPTIIAEMGFSNVNAQGLSAPPYFVAFLFVMGSCYIADKTSQRGFTLVFLSVLGGVGYIMLATSTRVSVRYAGVYLAAAGVFPCIANILPWVLNNQGSDTRRGAGIAILNLIGQCGPLLGTRLYPANEKPYYRKGMWICAAFMLFNGVLALGLSFLLKWENKRLDEKYGGTDAQQAQSAVLGEENDGPGFRYIL